MVSHTDALALKPLPPSGNRGTPTHVMDRDRLLLLAALIGVFAASVALPYTPLMGTTVCVIKWTTGWSCPGCGLGRSFVAMSAGDLEGAWRAHALGPPLYVAAAFWLVRTCLNLRASRPDVD